MRFGSSVLVSWMLSDRGVRATQSDTIWLPTDNGLHFSHQLPITFYNLEDYQHIWITSCICRVDRHDFLRKFEDHEQERMYREE